MKTVARRYSISVLFVFSIAVLQAQEKIAPLRISHLVDNFYVYTTHQNFNGVQFPSNSLYVVTNAGVVLIDTPWDTTQCQPLLDSIYKRHQQKVVLCLATHFHEDRTGGFAFFNRLAIPTFSSKKTFDFSKRRGMNLASHVFTRDTTFNIGSVVFSAFYPGEGHSKDNIVVWFTKARILYGGCFVKSTEAKDLGNLNDANPSAWPASIKKVKANFPSPLFIIPGHQGWASLESLDYTTELLKLHNKKR